MNNWNGVGLPPVGEVVEYTGDDGVEEGRVYDAWKNGDPLEVLAIRVVSAPTAIVFNQRTHEASAMNEEYFRPTQPTGGNPTPFQLFIIKSEREKAIEEIMQISGCFMSAAISLYDAGYRKQELE